jgi:hypothetical protein
LSKGITRTGFAVALVAAAAGCQIISGLSSLDEAEIADAGGVADTGLIPPDGQVSDSDATSTDSATDVLPVTDTGATDSGVGDVLADVSTDVSPDATLDGGIDATPDAAADAGVDAAADAGSAPNTVFVTSIKNNGNFGALDPMGMGDGIRGADKLCNDRAQAGGLPNVGSYVAWLSKPGLNARDRLAGARGWVNTNNQPVFDNVVFAPATGEGLTGGKMFYAVQYDEFKDPVLFDTADFVFTGTDAIGALTADSPSFGNAHCSSWTSAATGSKVGFANIGYAFQGTVGWTEADVRFQGGGQNCQRPGRLYCFGTGRNVPVAPAPTPPTIRRAFLTTGTSVLTGGLAAADARCNAEKGVQPGTYKAYMALTSQTAHSRFDTQQAKGGWYRADGVPVFPDPTKLSTSTAAPVAPVVQFGSGAYMTRNDGFAGRIWTGLLQGNGNASSSCSNWTSNSGGQTGNTGNARSIGAFFLNGFEALNGGGSVGGDWNCDVPAQYLCLQE